MCSWRRVRVRERGQRVALNNAVPAGLACLQFLGNWVTPTAPCLPSIRAIQNGGPALKRVFLPQKNVRSYFLNEDKCNLTIPELCINELAGFWKGRPLTWNLFIKQGSYLTPHISEWVWMAETTQTFCGNDCLTPLRVKHARSLIMCQCTLNTGKTITTLKETDHTW